MNLVQLKNSKQTEWKQIREICFLTASEGRPLQDPSRFKNFTETWVGPYQKYFPCWTWVYEDDQKKILGYITTTPSTSFYFQVIKNKHRWFVLKNFLCGKIKWNLDVEQFFLRNFFGKKSPEKQFSNSTWEVLHKHYPAHLHINFREEARGQGLGKKLTSEAFQALKKENIPGVHLFCTERAKGFYEKLGFKVLDQIKVKPKDVTVYCLGLKL